MSKLNKDFTASDSIFSSNAADFRNLAAEDFEFRIISFDGVVEHEIFLDSSVEAVLRLAILRHRENMLHCTHS